MLATYPAEKVNGFMGPHRSLYENFEGTYPEHIKSELIRISSTVDESRRQTSNYKTEYDKVIFEEKKKTLLEKEISLRLLEQYKNLDFYCFYFKALDTIQHKFWKFMEPGIFNNDLWQLNKENIGQYKDVINSFYILADRIIGDLIQKCNLRETTVLIISDHGFRGDSSAVKRVNINKLLNECGLLNFDEFGKIDHSASKASGYFSGGDRIYVRLMNGYAKTDFLQLLQEITYEDAKRVLEWNNESNYRPMDIEKKGSFDVALTIPHVSKHYEKIYIRGKAVPSRKFERIIDNSGQHNSSKGVFIAAWDNIKKLGGSIKNISIYDIMSTLLYLLKLPVAQDMSGKVLTDIISERFLKNNKIRKIETYGNRQPGKEKKDKPDKSLINKLRMLGYID